MPLTSDITINAAKFSPAAVSEKTSKLNEEIKRVTKSTAQWWDIGVAQYRKIRLEGSTSLPKPTVLPQGKDITIPSRDSDRSIPCRLFGPPASAVGVLMHIHGGGWVYMSEKTSDTLLQRYANASNCTIISVGYRLAPEDPFPAGPEDCFDAAEYLVKNAVKEYGGPLRFMGGESAGAHLSILTTFQLLRAYPTVPAPVLLLHFGAYDLSGLPQLFHATPDLVLDMERVSKFVGAFLPGKSVEERKNPSISPFYENIEEFRGRLPKALFTCGTADCLLDDTVMMGTRYLMAGGEAIIKIYEGGCHGFIGFQDLDLAAACLGDTTTFIHDCLGK